MTEALKLNPEISDNPQPKSGFELLENEEFDPEKALRLRQKERLITAYMDRLKSKTSDKETITYIESYVNQAADIITNPESIKKLRERRIEKIDSEDNSNDMLQVIAFGMDADFWQSPEYLNYLKNKSPDIYKLSPEQVREGIMPYLKKLCENESIEKLAKLSNIFSTPEIFSTKESISATKKFFSNLLEIPNGENIDIKYFEDEEKIKDFGNDLVSAYYDHNDKAIHLTKPLEFFEKNPKATIALIGHEMFHAHQHSIADENSDNPESIKYRQNFQNYIPISTDQESYVQQKVEAEAWLFETQILSIYGVNPDKRLKGE